MNKILTLTLIFIASLCYAQQSIGIIANNSKTGKELSSQYKWGYGLDYMNRIDKHHYIGARAMTIKYESGNPENPSIKKSSLFQGRIGAWSHLVNNENEKLYVTGGIAFQYSPNSEFKNSFGFDTSLNLELPKVTIGFFAYTGPIEQLYRGMGFLMHYNLQ